MRMTKVIVQILQSTRIYVPTTRIYVPIHTTENKIGYVVRPSIKFPRGNLDNKLLLYLIHGLTDRHKFALLKHAKGPPRRSVMTLNNSLFQPKSTSQMSLAFPRRSLVLEYGALCLFSSRSLATFLNDERAEKIPEGTLYSIVHFRGFYRLTAAYALQKDRGRFSFLKIQFTLYLIRQ